MASSPPDEPPRPFDLDRAPGKADLVVDDNGVTFLIVAAGGVSTKTLRRLQLELDTGRWVSVVATPTAAAWLDHYQVGPVIEAMTGWPVRSQMQFPTMPTFDPPGPRVVVSPCTLNTLTKWWAAHSDNLALSLLCEAVGRGIGLHHHRSLSSDRTPRRSRAGWPPCPRCGPRRPARTPPPRGCGPGRPSPPPRRATRWRWASRA